VSGRVRIGDIAHSPTLPITLPERESVKRVEWQGLSIHSPTLPLSHSPAEIRCLVRLMMSNAWHARVTGEGMHSSDRTMLAKLGFADKDRKTPRHDLACLYLAQTETALELIDSLRLPPVYRGSGEEMIGSLPTKVKTSLEYHLRKGEGQYSTTIGFLDLIYEVKWGVRVGWTTQQPVYRRNENGGTDYSSDPFPKGTWLEGERRDEGSFFIEVKIEPTGYGEILRQLNLYRTYFISKPILPGVLVTDWVLPVHERKAIEQHGYKCFHLGDRFSRWVEAMDQEQTNKGTQGL
jgi:hypothetical protein